MSKVTDVQLALHQICADEANPRSMTAHIMHDNGITTDDVMMVCDVAYLAVEDMRSRNLKASLPDFNVETMDAAPPSRDEMQLIADQELPQMPDRTVDVQQMQQPKPVSRHRASWYDTVMQDIQSGVVKDEAAEERARMRAQTEANKAAALRIAHGEAT